MNFPIKILLIILLSITINVGYGFVMTFPEGFLHWLGLLMGPSVVAFLMYKLFTLSYLEDEEDV